MLKLAAKRCRTICQTRRLIQYDFELLCMRDYIYSFFCMYFDVGDNISIQTRDSTSKCFIFIFFDPFYATVGMSFLF